MMRVYKKYTLVLNNPELTRNLWQELTPQRLVVIPSILLLIIILAKTMGNRDFSSVLMWASSFLFTFVVVLWGTKLASESLMQEFSEGTWDTQRMSGLHPMQMVWGKLLGGTAAAWYAGIILLVFSVAGGLANPYLSVGSVFKINITLVLFALIMHSMCMSSLLALWRKSGHQLSRRMRGVALLPILLFFLLWWISGFILSFFQFRQGDWEQLPSISWFGLTLGLDTIGVVTLFCLAVWFVVGLWQQMRSELQFRNQPWWWLGFLVFWMVYMAGFVNASWSLKGVMGSPWHIYLILCLLGVMFSVYMQLFYENKNAMRWLRFFSALKSGDFSRFRSLFPAWATSYMVGLAVAVVLVLWVMVSPPKGEDGVPSSARAVIILGVISILLFVLRDIALVLWLNLSKHNQRADGAAFIYLLVLYFLLPCLVLSVSRSSTAVFLFLPLLGNGEVSAAFLLSPLLQAGVVMKLLYNRWQECKGKMLD